MNIWVNEWKSLSHVWLFVNPWTTQSGILQARILEWVAFPFSRGSFQSRNWNQVYCIAGEGNGNPFQYSCLETPMDREAWQAAVHEGAKSWTRLSDFTFTFMHWRRKWQPTPVFLPGESQGWRSLAGCCLWGRTESDATEETLQQQQHIGILTKYANLPFIKCSIIYGNIYPKENICQRHPARCIKMFTTAVSVF